MPKSTSFTLPFARMRTLAGFTSRWIDAALVRVVEAAADLDHDPQLLVERQPVRGDIASARSMPSSSSIAM